ncbi:hypothetical protein [Nonomuraea sp. LPB2021202275-12-8]|uniref:hypothetical protein n=1 Tax=Nonomuraea sp. LPB2021202275-12-8 TaxID=3120159 RepID=UPI00300D87AE
MDPKAIFAFGYDLGAHGTEKLKEASKFGDLPGVAWYDPDNDDDGPIEQAELHLLAAAGVKVSEGPDHETLLKEHLGVWFERYGWDGEPDYLLTAYVLKVDWDDDARPLDFAELAKQVVQHDLDTKLADALAKLGVTPTQERPVWLHCAYGD